MNKAITVLKIVTIILNAFLLISSVAILAVVGMPSDHIAHTVLVIISLLAPVACIISLAFSKKLMSGFLWLLSSAATIFTNAVLLGFIIYALTSWGMPGIAGQNFLVPFWLTLPIFSCTTLFLVRGQIKKSRASDCNSITCPNCGTEIPKD